MCDCLFISFFMIHLLWKNLAITHFKYCFLMYDFYLKLLTKKKNLLVNQLSKPIAFPLKHPKENS